MNAEIITFAIAGAFAVIGALGVVLSRNPVHSALFLVQTLFSIAVLFIAKEAYFLAAIQVIVYAGAIVILFLFVIMLVGVDRSERLEIEPVVGIRPVAVVAGGALLAALVTIILVVGEATGRGIIPIDPEATDIEQLGDVLFTDWVFAFQLTALLLTIAVVGAVVLARRPNGDLQPLPEPAPMVVDYFQALEAEDAAFAGDAPVDGEADPAGDQEDPEAESGSASSAGGEDTAGDEPDEATRSSAGGGE